MSTESTCSFQALFNLLLSSALDASVRSIRAKHLNTAKVLVRDDAVLRLLASGWGLIEIDSCSSNHAKERVVEVVIHALVACAEKRYQNNEKEAIADAICLSICRLIHADTSLLIKCTKIIDGAFSNGIEEGLKSFISDSFWRVLSQSANDDKCGLEYTSAVSLASHLRSSSNIPDKQKAELFVTCTLLRKNVTAASYIQLSAIYLKSLSQDEFDSIAPTLGLKLRAAPETSLDTINAILCNLSSSLSMSNHLEGETKFLSSTLKYFRSSKFQMRHLAWSVVSRLAILSGKPAMDDGPMVDVVKAVALMLPSNNQAPTNLTLSQADQRIGVYTVFKEIAVFIMNNIKDGTKPRMEYGAVHKILDLVLDTLVRSLAKEVAGDTQEVGYKAFFNFLVIAKKTVGTKSSCYLKAVQFLLHPVLCASRTSTNSFRLRVGSIFTFIENEEHFESIALDLFHPTVEEEKVNEGLQAIVELAVKKHAKSDIVPQIDGLIAVFLQLLNFNRNIDSLENIVLPAMLKKSIRSGAFALGSKTSFVFSRAMADASAIDLIVSRLLHLTIALYSKILYKIDEIGSFNLVCFTENGEVSAAAKALACCISNPTLYPSTVESTVKTVLKYSSPMHRTPDVLVAALFQRVNELANSHEQVIKSTNDSREAREAFLPINENKDRLLLWKGKVSPACQHCGINLKSVRSVSNLLVMSQVNIESLASAIVLFHVGTTSKVRTNRQRKALVSGSSRIITKVLLPFLSNSEDDEKRDAITSSIASSIVNSASSPFVMTGKKNESSSDIKLETLSPLIRESALSLILSLGAIAGNFDAEFDQTEEENIETFRFAWKLCVNHIGVKLAQKLENTMEKVQLLNKNDIGVYRTLPGNIFFDHSSSSKRNGIEPGINKGEKKLSKNRKGVNAEEEEWERQVKEEIARKKGVEIENGTLESSAQMLPSDIKLLESQNKKRGELVALIDGDFHGTVNAIRYLCQSEIEVGHAILPLVSPSVISALVSSCSAMTLILSLRTTTQELLVNLASCVYEIDETYATIMAHALFVCCRKESPITSQSAPIACVILEIEEYGDCLSSNSFAFCWPVLRECLVGERTPSGCEGVLKLVNQHTQLLTSFAVDSTMKDLRKDMASAVLQLLCYDNSQKFVNPTPFETLLNVYSNDKCNATFTSSELAPLLGEIGALGPDNCRLGSFLVLSSISSNNPKVLKNPLIENRILVNCFADNDSIREEACSVYKKVFGSESSSSGSNLPPPSKLFTIPLLPLLSHNNQSIADSAAKAFAFAISKHHDILGKNLDRLCSLYIDAYPTSFDNEKSKSTKKTVPIVPKSKTTNRAVKLSTGLPKKKTIKKNITAMSILAPKKKPTMKSKKALASALAPKSNERVIDKAELKAQFSGNTVDSKSEEKDSKDMIKIRKGVIQVFDAMATAFVNVDLDVDILQLLVGFLVAFGLADCNTDLCTAARNALRNVVATICSSDDAISVLMPVLERTLDNGQADPTCLGILDTAKILEDVSAKDRRKEGVVVALGSLAIHLNDTESCDKIDSTVDMLITTLATPSESVQASVAGCLSKLMKKGNSSKRIEKILSNLMQECLNGTSMASQRGAAYGISAIVKGSGIASLKKFGVVKQLEEACLTGTAKSKEGSLFAIELLSSQLGLLFEPYVIVLLPALLQSFSDTSNFVREAATTTVGLIMSKLSGHGVKLLMPAVLSGLENEDWRTKQASIQMLGAMSHCAPKQLASCLPKVVPKLTIAFSDTHQRVKTCAKEALDEISKVIRNPEIAQISDILLKALIDPNSTVRALENLIETEFLHAIDAPSLALIVPVVHRGLRDRAATTKRYGALIAGNMVTMVNDPRDFVPYLPTILPALKVVLLDPIPDCRSTAAKALGSLTRVLGEATFPELRQWLIETLTGEGSTLDRCGAAQGLSEVLCAGGAAVVEHVMREQILPLKDHSSSSTREGVLWILTFLPSSLGQSFASLIDASFPALINGLSDDTEQVRDVAMRAARVTIQTNGKVHIDKILPSLESGLIDDDYRIRVASLRLLGDLLSMISGNERAKGDRDTQEDMRQAERAQAQIALVLGPEKRKRVLSNLYLRRCDSTAVVRQNAVTVWKTFVSVTARTLREILDTLVEKIVKFLASGDPEHTQVAGRCLGDIVTKLGEVVLPRIVPLFHSNLSTGDKNLRLGAVVGLTEIISCASKEQVDKFIEILVKTIQNALCDEDEDVRNMAVSSFESLFVTVGNKAFDEVVPALLAAMETSSNEDNRAVLGLTGIVSRRSRELLPLLVPRLIHKPMTENQASALGNICTETGDSIHYYFPSIIPTILTELCGFYNKELSVEEQKREEAIRHCIRVISSSVHEAGARILINEIASKCGSDKEQMRKESCWVMQVIVEERKEQADFYDQLPIMFKELLQRLNDPSEELLKMVNAGLNALTKGVPIEQLVEHIEFIRYHIASVVSDARRRKGGVGDGEFFLPGFNMAKGLEPLMPIYHRGILYGNAEVRQVAAEGLGEMISLTAKKFLVGPFIVKTVGPLLRIVGKHNPPVVKIAIIKTLGLILDKGAASLRAFVPQFQTTFVKSLLDPSRQVRIEAIKALALLIPLSTRIDPLLKELISHALGTGVNIPIESAGIVAIQTASLDAISVVLFHGGKKVKLPESIPSALDTGKKMVEHDDEGVREAAAKVIGISCELLGKNITEKVVEDLILKNFVKDIDYVKHGKICCCYRIFSLPIANELGNDVTDKITNLVKDHMLHESSLVKEASCIAIGAVLGSAHDTLAILKLMQPNIILCMDPKGNVEVLKSIALGLSIAVQMKPNIFDGSKGMKYLDAALRNSMRGSQRVQLTFNDFLWLALNVDNGDAGLLKYVDLAMFDNVKAMKSLHSKVLSRMKHPNNHQVHSFHRYGTDSS